MMVSFFIAHKAGIKSVGNKIGDAGMNSLMIQGCLLDFFLEGWVKN